MDWRRSLLRLAKGKRRVVWVACREKTDCVLRGSLTTMGGKGEDGGSGNDYQEEGRGVR